MNKNEEIWWKNTPNKASGSHKSEYETATCSRQIESQSIMASQQLLNLMTIALNTILT